MKDYGAYNRRTKLIKRYNIHQMEAVYSNIGDIEVF